MIERLTLTEDVIKLIPHLNFTETPTADEIADKRYPRWGIDYNSIYGGSFLLEDLALILGFHNDMLPESIESPMGFRYPEEIEDRMLAAHRIIIENMKSIEEIIHQFVVKGGIKPGTYKCDNKIRLWEREDNE